MNGRSGTYRRSEGHASNWKPQHSTGSNVWPNAHTCTHSAQNFADISSCCSEAQAPWVSVYSHKACFAINQIFQISARYHRIAFPLLQEILHMPLWSSAFAAAPGFKKTPQKCSSIKVDVVLEATPTRLSIAYSTHSTICARSTSRDPCIRRKTSLH